MQILNTKPLLKNIKCPCLILTGSDDIVVSMQKSTYLINNIPFNQHKELQGVGHAPYCENHLKFNNIIYSFFNPK